MKRIALTLFILTVLHSPMLRADEGMWLPLLIERLNYVDMQEMGLNLTADEIYSVNHSSLKDAIIIFGRGCTGEIVSDQGLILTNHHCGYGSIQSHSSIEHDYLTDGFWAGSLEEELPNEGLTAQFLIRIEDVTQRVLSTVDDQMTEASREEAIRKISREIETQATAGTHYNASVRSFYFGNEFYLFVYETYTDVRLVGAPPSSIGKFGADTDNWMWPRHTGDFSLFRVYSGPDGKPAPYSKSNIPLKPRYFLPISLEGVQKGDFAMILGYPGSTDRYLPSYGVEEAIDQNNPSVVKIRQQKLDILREAMDSDPAIRIQYASKYAGTSNYWKYYIGQTKGLKRLKVADDKKATEAAFAMWIATSPDLTARYGTILNDMEKAYEILKPYDLFRIYSNEGIFRGCEIISFARNFSELYRELGKEEVDQKKVDQMVTSLKSQTTRFFKDYDAPTDQKLLSAMLELFYNDIPESFHPQVINDIHTKFKGDFCSYVAKTFAKTLFSDQGKVMGFLDKPSAKILEKDPVFSFMTQFTDYYRTKMSEVNAQNTSLGKSRRLYMEGLRTMRKDHTFYPDANFTMRLTYGQILDYYPSDAVHYDFRTSLAGVMEKEDPSNWEFVVPDKLKDLYARGDFGPYGEKDVLYTCFISNLDITGGNSGSPVINGNGELIGLAFDGNWEAMSGDIAYEPGLQRTISVDIRYVLFIIDKYAGADRIISEMTILKPVKQDVPKRTKTAEKTPVPEPVEE
ncbi:MAG: S46 family peptidase [Bacteroidales bacterium]|nr:S46 family peptidase [Lentimicrobiaceae bacterium]MDD5693826.1 S46 family peptidase [Bacteroidales bacterium]